MNREAVKRRYAIVGESPELNKAIDVAVQVAPTEVTVLVVGENGTGKDVFSRIIHQNSHRKHESFIAINCGAIPGGTIDSELFGHEKGAFTSAHEARKGYFEEVDGGVIFLDEIGEMPLSTQARLLRVLENGEYLRVGSSQVRKTNVRIIAATNKNLVEHIREGKFREDLYFRLNTVTIYVPPLRERTADIERLFRYFASQFAEQYRRQPLRLSEEAKRLLVHYHWPGNVRELRNFVERMSVLSDHTDLSGEDVRAELPVSENRLPVLFRGGQDEGAHGRDRNGHRHVHEDPPPSGREDLQFLYRFLFELKNDIDEIKYAIKQLEESRPYHDISGVVYPAYARPALQQPQETGSGQGHYVVEEERQEEPETLSLEAREQDLIARALQKHGQNRKKAAQELGISERTLYRKIKSYGLDAHT